MTFPTIHPRTFVVDGETRTLSMHDFVCNNWEAAEWLLDNFEAALKAAYDAGLYQGHMGSTDAHWPEDLAELKATGINED